MRCTIDSIATLMLIQSKHCNVVTVGNGMPKTALINRILDEIDEHERKVVRLEGE